jgi:hypothetical protein
MLILSAGLILYDEEQLFWINKAKAIVDGTWISMKDSIGKPMDFELLS